MRIIGTPYSESSTKVLFCGGGELGKEVVIELQRFGVEVVVVDRYEDSPAMQVAHRSHVIDMLDPNALRKIVELEQPDLVVPEIEAIATSELVKLEAEGISIVPSAKAVHLTMNREGIRRLVSEELGVLTSKYEFADSFEAFSCAVDIIGYPCVVKPVMSSSGKGQSVLQSPDQLEIVWQTAQEGGRAGAGRVIIEEFVEFDYEITLLTCRHRSGVLYCDPIGHVQVDGDYRESWQPQAMSALALSEAKNIADRVTNALGGWGVFGVELFVKGDTVVFSEVSPRPHDTGLVTLVSQNLSEFCLHARAILGFPIPELKTYGSSASAALLVEGESSSIKYGGIEEALGVPGTDVRLFGKPEVSGKRRMGVGLAVGRNIEDARQKAVNVISTLKVTL